MADAMVVSRGPAGQADTDRFSFIHTSHTNSPGRSPAANSNLELVVECGRLIEYFA